MRPRDKKIGSKITILCPNCDGTGEGDINNEGRPTLCKECDGTGKIEGIVSRQ